MPALAGSAASCSAPCPLGSLRAGYEATYDPAFIGLARSSTARPMARSLEGFVDQEVTARIVTGLPTTAGQITVGVVDDVPSVVAAAQTLAHDISG